MVRSPASTAATSSWTQRAGAPGEQRRGKAAKGARLALDGVNLPGLIRNCGGTGDAPSVLRHDYTCTDPDEVIAFTEDFGSATPSGRGLEVVLDSQGTVTAVNAPGARP
jgi:hypothetical protein